MQASACYSCHGPFPMSKAALASREPVFNHTKYLQFFNASFSETPVTLHALCSLFITPESLLVPLKHPLRS